MRSHLLVLSLLVVSCGMGGADEQPPNGTTSPDDARSHGVSEAAPDESPVPVLRRRLAPGGMGPIDPESVIRDLDRFPPAPERKPYAVKTIQVIARTDTSIRLRWYDRSSVEDGTRVRVPGPTGFVDIFTYGPVSGSQELLDEGLQPDTLYCYQFVVFNEHGESPSQQRCAYTRDAEGLPISRAQVRVVTADVRRAASFDRRPDSDTNDRVVVRLNSPPGVYDPAGNATAVDYGRDDFERGDDFTYDLNLTSLASQGDVTILGITKEGKDPWCIEAVELLLNNIRVYRASFEGEADGCLWLDEEGTSRYTAFHPDLRAHPDWGRFGPTIQLRISREEIESRIESIVGDLLAGEDRAQWGDKGGRAWVEATHKNESTLHLDLDLEGVAPGWFNPSVDVDFDLTVGFEAAGDGDWTLQIETVNFETNADFDWFAETLSFVLPCGPIVSVIVDEGIPDCISRLEDYIEDRIRASWVPIARSVAIGSPCADGERPHAEVTGDADVDLSCVEDTDARPGRLSIIRSDDLRLSEH